MGRPRKYQTLDHVEEAFRSPPLDSNESPATKRRRRGNRSAARRRLEALQQQSDVVHAPCADAIEPPSEDNSIRRANATGPAPRGVSYAAPHHGNPMFEVNSSVPPGATVTPNADFPRTTSLEGGRVPPATTVERQSRRGRPRKYHCSQDVRDAWCSPEVESTPDRKRRKRFISSTVSRVRAALARDRAKRALDDPTRSRGFASIAGGNEGGETGDQQLPSPTRVSPTSDAEEKTTEVVVDDHAYAPDQRQRFQTEDGGLRAYRGQQQRPRLLEPFNDVEDDLLDTHPPIVRSLDFEDVADDDDFPERTTAQLPTVLPVPLRTQRARRRVRGIALDHHEEFNPANVRGTNVADGRHHLGQMSVICPHCRCYKWNGETKGSCCREGDITLPNFEETPPALKALFDSQDFVHKIRAYNMVFAFTSLGTDDPKKPLAVDRDLASARDGVYTFRIQGTICHRIGAMLPLDNQPRAFAQIYIFDPDLDDDANLNRQVTDRVSIMGRLDANVVRAIERELQEYNVFAQTFKHLGKENPRQRNVRLRIFEDVRTDLRRFNKPTVSEVAGLIVDVPDNGRAEGDRDLLVARQSGAMLRIFETWAQYDPLQYPLLLPRGELGWSKSIRVPQRRGRNGTYFSLTAREFYAYRLYSRDNDNSLILRGGRLFQQYCVDQYAKIEAGRLRFVRMHQQKHRTEVLSGVNDMVMRDVTDLAEVGKTMILPASFTGSDRYMKQQYYDAMAIVRCFGPPDLFITVTCNPKWPEITENLMPRQTPGPDGSYSTIQTPTDRPDLIARVFKLKLDAIMNDIKVRRVFGAIVTYFYVIEYQKRGLPHAHIVVRLQEQDRPRCPEDFDKFTSAEIPDPDEAPELYDTVVQNMMHGPCGSAFPSAACMKEGQCSKKFPKPFASESRLDENGFPVMKRRPSDRRVMRRRVPLDNRWVVPYNPYLSQKYNCHINVEICGGRGASVKYLYKYICKGGDRARIAVSSENGQRDEIKQFQDARYISNVEACWRILDYCLQMKMHHVQRLALHVENGQVITYAVDANASDVVNRDHHTMLTRFFELCASDDDAGEIARNLLYHEVPLHFTWQKDEKRWVIRRRGDKMVGRLVSCSPMDIERYHLRLLLCNVKGPKSFQDIRTVDGIEYPSYREACRALGLLDDDTEWFRCMEEAEQHKMPVQLRHLFATILVYCPLSDIKKLWDEYVHSMSEDYQRLFQSDHQDRRVLCATVRDVNSCLLSSGKSLQDYPSLPQLEAYADVDINVRVNRLILAEKSYNREELQAIVEHVGLLNSDQLMVFNTIIESVRDPDNGRRCFFLDGPGGTGKSFVLEQILAQVRLDNHIAIPVASSGIAALLLTGGRTVHSRFKVPLELNDRSTCPISKQSDLAQLYQAARLIIWDEAAMAHRHALEAINRTLQDIRGSELPFGGIVVLLSGDFRQILPVVPRGSDGDVVNACLKRSPLWRHFETLQLKINMRVRTSSNPSHASDIQAFSDFLLKVGNGQHEPARHLGPSFFQLPQSFVLPPGETSSMVDPLIDYVYRDIGERYLEEDYFVGRAILTPITADVNAINDLVMCKLPDTATDGTGRGNSVVVKTYHSIDSAEEPEGLDETLHQQEILNSIRLPGMPPHKLTLKRGAVIMLIRNLNADQGLCNGTRLQVLCLSNNCIRAKIITGARKNQEVFIPRITLISDGNILPFKLRRRQFPVQIAFAMTINKAQGQSVDRLGIFLPQPVFTHGQMYVALSRCTNKNNIKIVVAATQAQRQDSNSYTKNIVFTEVLDHERQNQL